MDLSEYEQARQVRVVARALACRTASHITILLDTFPPSVYEPGQYVRMIGCVNIHISCILVDVVVYSPS
jgi:hypothetical protein